MMRGIAVRSCNCWDCGAEIYVAEPVWIDGNGNAYGSACGHAQDQARFYGFDFETLTSGQNMDGE